ncbi:MAG: flagellar biosynthetic protein FliQ [Deltaproteobacteria bacterium]|nr:flagellar biosynthetic protein FliQ [Deltaproteobacteria bacterium]
MVIASAPPLLASLVAGALFSALQAITSIQESTLSVVPKLVAAILSLVIAGPWIGAQLARFTTEILRSLPVVGR